VYNNYIIKIKFIDKIMENQSFNSYETDPSKEAQQEIDHLSPELKAVADKYLGLENTPEEALKQVRAQQEIDHLSPELKAVADRYLGFGNTPEEALKQVYEQL
jgi:hypothetical protein